jgi:hypothetical protein
MDWPSSAPPRRRVVIAVGLGLVVSVFLLGVSVLAVAALAHASGAVLFGGGQQPGRSGTAAGAVDPRSLALQRTFVDGRRAAVAAYAADLAEFKAVTARAPGAVGINLNAAEARRRDAALSGLVLECINAVDRYNLAAAAPPATQLQSHGLPERFVWAVDCAAVQ